MCDRAFVDVGGQFLGIRPLLGSPGLAAVTFTHWTIPTVPADLSSNTLFVYRRTHPLNPSHCYFTSCAKKYCLPVEDFINCLLEVNVTTADLYICLLIWLLARAKKQEPCSLVIWEDNIFNYIPEDLCLFWLFFFFPGISQPIWGITWEPQLSASVINSPQLWLQRWGDRLPLRPVDCSSSITLTARFHFSCLSLAKDFILY